MRIESRLLSAVVAVGLIGSATSDCFAPDAKGKLSKNIYRMPYQNGESITVSQDYVGHGSTPAGNTGPMDMNSSSNPSIIVAAAPGRVIALNDSRNDCGCHANFGPCANIIDILHDNGEMSRHLHIQQNSASVFAGLSVNDCVVTGQIIAIEGDVGWTCSNSTSERLPVVGTCINTLPDPLITPRCGRHLHWEIRDLDTDEFVNPITCGITGWIYQDNGNYVPANCTTAGCPTDVAVPSVNLNGLGSWQVVQADNDITADDVQVQNSASMVMHAGNSVRLLPGVAVLPGGHFRAEIGPCNTTSGLGCPPP